MNTHFAFSLVKSIIRAAAGALIAIAGNGIIEIAQNAELPVLASLGNYIFLGGLLIILAEAFGVIEEL